MKKKVLIVSLLFVGMVGISTAFADRIFLNPELNILQKLSIEERASTRMQEKISGIHALEEEELRLRANKYISPDEQTRIIKEKTRGHEEQLKQMVESPVVDVIDTYQFRGIFEGIQVPAPFSSEEFKVINYWGGEIDGKRVGVYAGYLPHNPSQGALVIFKS